MPDDPRLNGGAAPRRLVLRSEFGIVAVSVCGPPGRERLRVEDLRDGASIELDPLELESLAWASHRDLADLLDPSLTRWPSQPDPPQHDAQGG
jgi:hypothetical protein